MPTLKINSDWIDTDEKFRPEFDQTYGKLGIAIDGAWVTEFETGSGARGERLEVPTYALAEWIAENWWALLYEPEKGERSRKDPYFRARHWLGSAREGFVLPDAWIHSLGKGLIQVRAEPSFFPHARIVLPNAAETRLRIEDVERELGGFVESVIERLNVREVTDTNLHAVWAAFKSLGHDERRFCQLVGALGMSPYDTPPGIADLLTGILGDASEQVAEDFCDAADEGDVLEAASDMVQTLEALKTEPELDFSKLFRLHNRGEAAPKRVASNAIRAVRDQFRIRQDDPKGGEAFLESLALNSIIYDRSGLHDVDDPVLHGSLRRHANTGRINLIRKNNPARRFDAARAAYLAWSQSSDGDRLVTRARVPDQQASRIFAAELLAPIAYIRSKTNNNVLSHYGAAEISETLNVSSAVVAWQAKHNRINVVGQHGGQWS
jgi:hypothetical protein